MWLVVQFWHNRWREGEIIGSYKLEWRSFAAEGSHALASGLGLGMAGSVLGRDRCGRLDRQARRKAVATLLVTLQSVWSAGVGLWKC